MTHSPRILLERLPFSEHEAIAATVARAVEHFGDRFVAAYALGSLGYGAFVEGWSDVDIDIIVDDDRPADALAEEATLVRSAVHANEAFAAVDVKAYTIDVLNDSSVQYEYGIANRAVMLLDSAKLIAGKDIRADVVRPTSGRLRVEAVAVARGLLAHDDAWWASRPLDDVAALLALPGRLLETCETGRVIDKPRALARTLEERALSARPDVWPWLVWALAVRTIPAARIVPASAAVGALAAARKLLDETLPRLTELVAAE